MNRYISVLAIVIMSLGLVGLSYSIKSNGEKYVCNTSKPGVIAMTNDTQDLTKSYYATQHGWPRAYQTEAIPKDCQFESANETEMIVNEGSSNDSTKSNAGRFDSAAFMDDLMAYIVVASIIVIPLAFMQQMRKAGALK